ncbi:MAG: Obg family GTPase CgtA, partial [Candidatus Subteraquimicrobiales bacterium]|nr:Obg family GTPase CgtA [Candidatus Subteraquimicrobiales bacterium]
AEKGEAGEERCLVLDLRCLADVGLIGYPNVGKSTLISRISAAKPKIANYPFTTRVPHLGVVRVEEGSFVVADIPGLIEGAHKGRGLGHVFLKHIDRAALLVHVLDLEGTEGRDPIDDFEKVQIELQKYSKNLSQRPQIVVGNKIDLPSARENISRVTKYLKEKNYPLYPISSVTGEGMDTLLFGIFENLKVIWQEKKSKKKGRKIIIKPEKRAKDFTVLKEVDGSFVVQGTYVERLVSMTDMNNEEAVAYLQKRLRETGVEKELIKRGAKDGDLVRIGSFEFDFYSG